VQLDPATPLFHWRNSQPMTGNHGRKAETGQQQHPQER